jgi:N-carbamoylputrescine amidase
MGTMTEKVRVAAVALDGRPGQTVENLDKIDRWCARAAAEGAQLVLFPELSITGFLPNHPAGDHAAWLAETLTGARRMAEGLNGPSVRRLAGIAKGHGVMAAAGLLEDAGNRLYNTHVLVGEGRVVAAWRKMHIPLFEMQVYNGGDGPRVVDTPLGRIDVNICFDAFLPESTRLLAVQNAEIVLFPFAADPPPVTPAGWAAWAEPVLRARCAENGVFGIACNYFGDVAYAGAAQRFPGGAMIVDPAGQTQLKWDGDASEPHILVADLHREALLAARSSPEYTFRFRRPEIYRPLAEHS